MDFQVLHVNPQQVVVRTPDGQMMVVARTPQIDQSLGLQSQQAPTVNLPPQFQPNVEIGPVEIEPGPNDPRVQFGQAEILPPRQPYMQLGQPTITSVGQRPPPVVQFGQAEILDEGPRAPAGYRPPSPEPDMVTSSPQGRRSWEKAPMPGMVQMTKKQLEAVPPGHTIVESENAPGWGFIMPNAADPNTKRIKYQEGSKFKENPPFRLSDDEKAMQRHRATHGTSQDDYREVGPVAITGPNSEHPGIVGPNSDLDDDDSDLDGAHSIFDSRFG